MDLQISEYLSTNNYARAIQTLNEYLQNPEVKGSVSAYLGCLVTRLECYFKLGQYEHVISEGRNILNGFYDPKEEKTFDKVIRCYINSLFQLKRYQETETLLKQWIGVKNGDNPEAFKLLNTLHSAIRNVGLKSPVDIHSEMASKLQVDPTIVTTLGLPHHHPLHPQQQQPHLPPQHPLNLQQQQQLPASAMVSTSASTVTIASSSSANASPMASVGPTGTTCTYCRLTFADKQLLRAHCQTLDHQRVIMSDEGRDWAWRAPPRGLSAEEYRLCASVIGTPAAAATSAAGASGAGCRYGLQCVEAHSQAELLEWRERFEYRKMKYQRAYEKELYGKSYTEEILDKWIEASAPDNVLKESLRYVQLIVDGKPSISITSKNSRHTWTFRLVVSRDPDEPRRILKGVALLQDTFRSHFQLAKVGYEIKKGKEIGDKGGDKNLDRTKDGDDNEIVEFGMKHDQEWLTIASAIPDCVIKDDGDSNQGCYIVSVMFKTDIFGTFRQSVVFDFGTEPYLVQHLCADVIPVTDHHRINELRHELVLSCEERWSASNSTIVPYSPPPAAAAAVDAAAAAGAGKGKKIRSAKEVEDMLSKTLSAKYPCPQANTLTLSPGTVTEKRLTKNNYNCRMHELLFIEEISRYDQVAKFNLTTHLLLVNSYLLSPNGMASTTAKYAAAGELFAALKLGGTLSEDTSAGRLVLSNCVAVLVRPLMNQRLSGKSVSGVTVTEEDDNGETNRVVYEAPIEDKGKTDIYIRLPAAAVKCHNLKPDQSFHCQIQFQLNRVPYCEWHHSVDSVTDYRLIFPETYLDPAIPWSPQRQWADITDPRLNVKQKEAVVAITTPMHVRLPPVLIIGPFGTGKTFTLAQAIKQLMRQPEARVLVCTHSNSAADLYIKDYLHPFVEEGHIEARPLRILYHKRWISTVNEVVQKYCLINTDPTAIAQGSYFHVPTAQDVMSHRIVVVTLNASMYLATLDLPRGFFTHIILDEAAQAMECEAIMPLAMANEATRIVLAGDHMQLSPELFSGFTKERNMHVSLLERLYDHYPPTFPCKILLSENYRAHEAIIDFTSESFYDQKLIASGRQPRHELYYPLTFFTTRGEDVQDTNSTAFYNNSEVYEIVDRVHELKNHWPTTWGKFDESSIGIMTPYADQVLRIRSELRKRRLFTISVERVLNVQGKQFRAVFLSTVRTRRTCTTSNSSSSSTATAAATKNNNAGGSGEEAEFGFLSNSKLLNTAITRAQSLVAVVGDPVALCTIGRCSKVWERFIQVCNENQSLFGITWSNLKNQLDGVELKKTYVLNPLAPEFIPRRLQQQQLQQQQQQQQLQQQQIQLQQQQLQQAAMMKAEHSYIHPLAHHIPNLQTALVKQTFFNGYDKKPFPFDASSAAAAAAAAAANAAAVTATGPVLPTQMVLSPDLLSRPPNTYDQLLPNRLQAYQYLSNPAAQTANVQQQQQQQPPPPPQAMHHPTYSMNQLPNGFNLLPRINNIHPAQAQVQPHHDSPNNGDLTSLYLRNAEQVQAGTSLQYLAEERKATLIPNIPNMSTNSMVHLDATSVALRLAYDLPNQAPANNGIQNKYLCLPTYQQQQQQPPPTSHDLTSVEALSNALSTSAGLQPTNLVNNHLQQPPQQQQQTVQNLYRNDPTLMYNQRPPAVAPIVNMLPDYSTVVTSSSNTNVNILSPGKQQEQQLELNQRFASNVQFLQNVHFPPDSKSAQQSQQIPNLTLARVEFTYQDLVPRGMSIDDVLQLPLQTKRQWYSFLAHNRGTEAARTFELLLDQALARKQQQQQQQLIAEMASPWINHHQQQQQMVMMNGNNCPPQINDDPRQNGYISSKVVQSESQPLYKRQGMQDQGLTIQQQQQLSYHQQEHVTGPPLSVGWSYPQATAGMSDGAGCSSSQQQQQQHKWKQEINEDFGNLSIQNGEDSVDDMVERYNGIMSYANVVRNSTANSSTAAKVDSKLDSCVTSNNSVDPQSLRNSRLYQYF